jgi:hypothetical protein
LLAGEIQIFNAQAQTFHEAQAAAIKQLGHEAVLALKGVDHRQRLLAAEDGRQAFGPSGVG